MYRLLLPLLLALSSLVFSDTDKVVLSVAEWPPYFSESLPHGGLIPHLVSKAFEDQGIELEYKYSSWGEAFTDIHADTFDASAGWLKTPERELTAQYSTPITFATVVFFHSKKLELNWETLSDVAQYNIGIVSGYSYGNLFDQFAKNNAPLITEYASESEALSALINRKLIYYPWIAP